MRRRRAIRGKAAPADHRISAAARATSRGRSVSRSRRTDAAGQDPRLPFEDRGWTPQAIAWSTRIGLSVGVERGVARVCSGESRGLWKGEPANDEGRLTI